MSIWRRLKYLLPSGRRAEERDMQEELESLRAMAEPHELGNLAQVAENAREVWGWNWLENFWKDLRYSFRMLRKNRAFTVVAILSLALGIGANTAVFSVIDALLLKRLPVEDPDRLVIFRVPMRGGTAGISYPVFEQFRARSRSFTGIFAHTDSGTTRMAAENGEEFELVRAVQVSANYFSVLGVNAVLGRTFPAISEPAEIEAVISYGYWQRRFAGDPQIVGKRIRFNVGPATIVGVAPEGFTGIEVGGSTDLWLPLETVTSPELKNRRNTLWLSLMARLNPTVSIDQARAEVDSIFRQLMAETTATSPGYFIADEMRIELEPGATGWTGLRQEFSSQLLILMSIVAFLLLIACANISGLLLARGAARRKEIAVRLAIGGSRLRVIRQLLTESATLAGIGAVAGLGFADWGTRSLLAYLPQEAGSSLNAALDIRALLFTTGVSVVSTLLFGLLPALQTTKLDTVPTLKGQAGDSGHWRRLTLNRLNVVFQVALSMILLVGAGLFIRTLQNLRSLDAGFDRDNVVQFSIDPGPGFSRPQLISLHREMLGRLEGLPGVSSVTFSANTMLVPGTREGSIAEIEGYTRAPDEGITTQWFFVAPKFFETVGLPLRMGRGMMPADDGTRVAVINVAMASKYFPGRNPIGLHFQRGDGAYEIIGVAQNARHHSLREEEVAAVYVPFSESASPINGFSMRAGGDRSGLMMAIRQIAKDLNPRIIVSDARTMAEVADATILRERLMAQLAGVCGLLALFLACIGLFGVLSYNVTQRTREIGIRMALGARAQQVTRAVLRETGVIVGIGLVLGLVGAVAATRFISSLLFEISTTDPWTIAGAGLVLAVAAGVAGYFPARRAARVDPLVALRCE